MKGNHDWRIYLLTFLTILVSVKTENETVTNTTATSADDPPEGYYAFVVSPNAIPPRVRPPPYRHVQIDCPDLYNKRPHVTANNLCGDLNKGIIPRNPMGQNPLGEPYPFELLRNQTLKFLSKTLPVLRADETLPRVTQLQQPNDADAYFADNGINGPQSERSRRSLELLSTDVIPSAKLPAEHRSVDELPIDGTAKSARQGRGFCDNGGVFCMLYKAINGDGSSGSPERREDPGMQHPHLPGAAAPGQRQFEGPPTPCPARVEYATPVFAKNYQGVWRYVVQIPYEGYFTQTIEVTRCMQSRCHYLDGGCLSSPRWSSLLVAELHYPRVNAQATSAPPVQDFQNYQQYLQKRAGSVATDGTVDVTEGSSDKPMHCDGHDEYGCFQVRLYYDWFLVPGSCKCWRPDYFARYVRRKSSGPEL